MWNYFSTVVSNQKKKSVFLRHKYFLSTHHLPHIVLALVSSLKADSLWNSQQQRIFPKPAKVDTHKLSGLLITCLRLLLRGVQTQNYSISFCAVQGETIWAQLPDVESYDLNQRSGKAVVTFRFQPAKQPTSGRLVIPGGERARHHKPRLAAGGPSSQTAAQPVKGGGR